MIWWQDSHKLSINWRLGCYPEKDLAEMLNENHLSRQKEQNTEKMDERGHRRLGRKAESPTCELWSWDWEVKLWIPQLLEHFLLGSVRRAPTTGQGGSSWILHLCCWVGEWVCEGEGVSALRSLLSHPQSLLFVVIWVNEGGKRMNNLPKTALCP